MNTRIAPDRTAHGMSFRTADDLRTLGWTDSPYGSWGGEASECTVTSSAPVQRIATLPVLLAVGFVILLAISGLTLWLVDRAGSDREQARAARELDHRLDSLLVQLRRAETAQFGHLLTGDREYLRDFEPSLGAVGPTLDAIKAAVANDPVQLGAISRLEPAVTKRVAELREIFRLHEAGDAAGAVALVKTALGSNREDLRLIVEGMQVEQGRQAALRLAASQRAERFGLALNLLGTALLVAVALLSRHVIARSLGEMRAAQQALERTNASLEATVAERTRHLTEANDEIQRFAAIVSHDLRSPLVNIMGFTTELASLRKDIIQGDGSVEDEMLGRDFDEAVGYIKGSIQKMERLINAILVVSREGGRPLRAEQIDTSALVQQVADGLAHKTQEIGASITVERLPTVNSDRFALEQVFSNLLDNAVKFLRADAPGRIEVTGSERGARIIFHVRDNGRGIDPSDRKRVFELFRRSGSLDRQGEGIGLAHVRSLLRRLGGSIRCDSTPGEGSTFIVTLPKNGLTPAKEWLNDESPDHRADRG